MAKETVLSCVPIEMKSNDPVGFRAAEHIKYLNVTLPWDNKTNEDIKALLVKNYSTKQ